MRRLLATLTMLALAACGGEKSTGPANVSIVGAWSGTLSSQVVSMTLAESNGAVTGSGTITNTPSGTRALTITGTYATGPIGNVNLTAASGTSQPFNIAGQVYATSMLVSLTGSGFSGDVLTLTRH